MIPEEILVKIREQLGRRRIGFHLPNLSRKKFTELEGKIWQWLLRKGYICYESKSHWTYRKREEGKRCDYLVLKVRKK